MRFMAAILLTASSASLALAQGPASPTQRIQFQYKKSQSFKEPVAVEVKSAVLQRVVNLMGKNQNSSIAVWLSTLEGDFCNFDATSKWILPAILKDGLTSDSDLAISLVSGLYQKRADIGRSGFHNAFFNKSFSHPLWLWTQQSAEYWVQELLPNQRVTITDDHRRGAHTTIMPKDIPDAPTRFVVTNSYGGWTLHHIAAKDGKDDLCCNPRGYALLTPHSDDSLTMKFKARVGKMETEGEVAVKICPSILQFEQKKN